ncbi:MAG: MoaD/ThiS family protein [Chloroflexota bacterium]|nr:MoaD/ThiS family protein [Chloroflexota bacterium]
MSVEIRMARGLRVHVDVPERVSVEGGTAREAIEALIEIHPVLRRFVLDDARRLRRHVNLFINDEQISDRDQLSDPVSDGDRIHILPAVSGGTSEDTHGLRSEHD